MRIIAKRTLQEFWANHADAEEALLAWYQDTAKAAFGNANEVKEYASSVSLLSGDRVCFNIKGNRYRLIVKMEFAKQRVYVNWVGTHAEYNWIDANKVKFREG